MNILIVSFDKNLINKLKEVLSEHNLMDVKNGEEAINTISSYMDVVIYDAVSGSISEEDINNMYRQKFKDSKYIVLVDDLFPVDMNNLMPPKKIRLMRDEAVNKIRDVIRAEPEEKTIQYIQEPSMEENLTIESFSFTEPAMSTSDMESPVNLREFELSMPEEVEMHYVEATEKPQRKLLLVSFDTALINNLREALAGRVEIIESRNIKEVIQKAKEADIILFDTISGMLAYRTLMDMSKDELLAKKPYVLLIDELFTIDVSSIPLEKKYSFTRETELSRAIEKVIELAEEPLQYPLQETWAHEQTTQEEDKSIMSLLEEIIGSSLEEEKPPAPTEEPEAAEVSSEELTRDIGMDQMHVISESSAQVDNIAESLITALEKVLREQLSQERVYSAISRVISPEDVAKVLSSLLERKLEEVLREKVSEVFSKLDVSEIVREEARKVLKEKLSELIT